MEDEPEPSGTPGCRCEFDPEELRDTAMVLTGESLGVTVRMAADLACPLHGGAARAMRRHALRGAGVPAQARG